MREWDYPKPKEGGLFPKRLRILMVELGKEKEWYRLDVIIGNRRFKGEPFMSPNARIFANRAAADLWKKIADVKAAPS